MEDKSKICLNQSEINSFGIGIDIIDWLYKKSSQYA